VQKLKLTLGILMLVALFTPLSQCSRGRKENALPPPAKTGWQKIFPRSDEYTDYDYGATRIDASLAGILTLVAFAWPLGLAFVGRRVRGKRRAWLFYILELLLCAGSIWMIYAISEGGTRLWGAYFTFALAALYAVAALADLFGSVFGRDSRSSSPSPP
jgi:hypothetical protein